MWDLKEARSTQLGASSLVLLFLLLLLRDVNDRVLHHALSRSSIIVLWTQLGLLTEIIE